MLEDSSGCETQISHLWHSLTLQKTPLDPPGWMTNKTIWSASVSIATATSNESLIQAKTTLEYDWAGANSKKHQLSWKNYEHKQIWGAPGRRWYVYPQLRANPFLEWFDQFNPQNPKCTWSWFSWTFRMIVIATQVPYLLRKTLWPRLSLRQISCHLVRSPL